MNKTEVKFRFTSFSWDSCLCNFFCLFSVFICQLFLFFCFPVSISCKLLLRFKWNNKNITVRNTFVTADNLTLCLDLSTKIFLLMLFRYVQMPRPFCFEPSNRYVVAVRFQRHGVSHRHLTAFMLIDSVSRSASMNAEVVVTASFFLIILPRFLYCAQNVFALLKLCFLLLFPCKTVKFVVIHYLFLFMLILQKGLFSREV